MLEIDFLNVSTVGRFTIRKGVGWQFCALSHRFKYYGQEAYFKSGVFMVTNEWISFRALDDWNTIYEVKLSAVETGEIRFWVSGKSAMLKDSPLRAFEKENREIDIAAFLKKHNQSEKITIFENVVEPMEEDSYVETLLMEIDRSRDILRFYLTVVYKTKCEEILPEGICNKEKGSRIKTMTLDREVTFDFCNHSFMEIMKKVTKYCERKNKKLSFCCKDFMLPSIGVDIPNTVVKSESFEFRFELENISEVYVAKDIMDSTYYTDTSGGEYNVGDIVRETLENKESTLITDYGASNLWLKVFRKDSEYIFGCWFS